MASKRKGGLGRGLEYLFADGILNEPASIISPDNAEEPSNSNGSRVLNGTVDDILKPLRSPEDVAPSAPATAVRRGPAAAESVVYVSLNDIRPNAAQPRKNFDREALQELADSIRTYGVIQPVLLRPAKVGYELVAGERRWRAARLAELKTIPAIIRDLDERQNAFYALIENMQREDLDPIEEAEGLQEIIGNYGLTQEEASKVVGKSRSYVTNSLRILKLPAEVKTLVQSKQLSAGHARAIAGLETKELMLSAAEKAAKEGWSVRQIETYTQVQTKPKKRRKTSKSRLKSADIRAVEEDLTQALGTRVAINGSEKRGKIEIDYFSRDELDRIIELLSEKAK